MRQGQQNRRGRGRNNNNNRKNQNPLSRSFESNGPDVKIRGTPAHIAEKYIALARDAQSSGDHVLAENYLQHAEHYNRIIMAYREQFQQHNDGMNGHRHQGQDGNGAEDMSEDDNEDILDEGFQGSLHQQPQVAQFSPQPQPMQHRQQGEGGQRYEGGREMRDHNRDHHRGDRPFRRDRDHQRFRDRNQDRGDRQDRPDRQDRQDRPMRDDRGPMMREERQPPREDRQPPREERQPPVEAPVEAAEPRRAPRERFQQPHEQPDFLRRPVRRPRSESAEAPAVKQEPSSE